MEMAAISLLILLLTSSVALVAATAATAATAGTVFGVELVHRDSPKSPLYNSSATPYDRAQAAALRSVNRASYLATRLTMKTFLRIDNGLIYESEYLMGIALGTPERHSMWAIVDTGSDLTWVNCLPCQCHNQTTGSPFNASASLTYKTLLCQSPECNSMDPTCGPDGTCQYHYGYGDGSNIDGILSTETFRFTAVASFQHISIPNVVFGCNFRSFFAAGEDTGALLGLGPFAPSLISQLAPKYIDKYFSYCLNPWVAKGLTSRLYLGRGNSTFPGNPAITPLMTNDGFYAVQLNTIAFPDVFEISFASRKSRLKAGNIIFDTGTVMTILDADVVQELVKKITAMVQLPTVTPVGVYSLCFAVRSSEQEELLPGLWFIFSGKSGHHRVSSQSLFVWVSRFVKCMAIVGRNNGIQIFGNIMQQNHLVGHDLENMELTIVDNDCSKSLS